MTDAERIAAHALRVALPALTKTATDQQRHLAHMIVKAALGLVDSPDEQQMRRFEAVMEGR